LSNQPTATGQLIDLLHRTRFEDLPTQVVHDTKRLIADTVGCALGARQYDAAEIVAQVASELGGPGSGGPASVVGTDLRVSPAAATSANMYLGNYLDADDTYLNFSHPGVSAVFPALAFAESLGLSGQELITAVALGYEVGCRVGGALEFFRRSESGEITAVPGNLSWYCFSIVGAAGRALGLGPAEYNNAFGLAGWTAQIQSGPFFAPILRPGKHMLKYTPVGFQGLAGVVATQLANKGFVGEQEIFDATEEFWVAFGSLGLNKDRLLGGLGEAWQVSETSFKPYALCRYGHPSVSLFNGLVERHSLRVEEIDSVVVDTFDRGVDWLGPDYPPQTPSDLQFNIPRAIAAAAYGSDLGPSWQTADNIADERQHAFAQKVRIEGHRDAGPVIAQQMMTDGRFRRIPNEVRITARGEVFSDSNEYSWGDPWTEQTRMTDEQLKDKFRVYAAEALPAAQSGEALDALLDLEQVKDVTTELAPLFRTE
jgi:2-methylcitrate dehydratase PrpD